MVVLTVYKFSKERVVEQICSFEVVEGMTDEKIEGSAILVAPVFFVVDDDKKMMKSVVVDAEKEIVCVNDDCGDVGGNVK